MHSKRLDSERATNLVRYKRSERLGYTDRRPASERAVCIDRYPHSERLDSLVREND